MSVLERLVQGGSDGNAAASLRTDEADLQEGGDDTAREEAPEGGPEKTASQKAREVLDGAAGLAAECEKYASDLRSELQKTASEGGDASGQEEGASFFEKIALTLRTQRVYAESLRKQGEASAKVCDALKVASDLMERGLLEIAEGQTMAEAVESLAKRDLAAVKVASEMFTDAAVAGAIGTAEKIATDKDKSSQKLDGSMKSWTEAHAFLLQ